MASLKRAIAISVLLWPAAGVASPVRDWTPEIRSAAIRFAIPEEWIRKVMRVESGGRTAIAGKPIVSKAGAIGLMQLMPGTWRDMRLLLGLGSDPHDPSDNILAGAFYLRLMFDRFGYPGLFAAYNAGPARYSAFLSGRRPLPGETRSYMRKVGAAGIAPAARRSGGAALAQPVTAGDSAMIASPASWPQRNAGPKRTLPLAPRSTGLFVELARPVAR